MTQQKTLTPKEALAALSAGRKLTKPDWNKDVFISLSDSGYLINQNGCFAFFGGDYLLYTEPKPKRKVAPYILRDSSVWMTGRFFEDDAECFKVLGSSVKIIRRVTELECEIED